ncbi:hypothetical protein V3C99_001278, partial [Haemonchus contortus]
ARCHSPDGCASIHLLRIACRLPCRPRFTAII